DTVVPDIDDLADFVATGAEDVNADIDGPLFRCLGVHGSGFVAVDDAGSRGVLTSIFGGCDIVDYDWLWRLRRIGVIGKLIVMFRFVSTAAIDGHGRPRHLHAF